MAPQNKTPKPPERARCEYGGVHLIESTNSVKVGSSKCENPRGWMRCVCTHGAIYWAPTRCRRCAGCLQNRKDRVIAKVCHGVEALGRHSLLTLTSRPGMTWEKMMVAFSRLVRFLRRTYGKVEYAAVKEEGGTSGMKHLHVLLLGVPYLPQVVISKAWERCSGAFVVDIRAIQPGRLAGYLAKYVGKGALTLGKTVTFSSGWPRSEKPKLLDMWPVCGEPVPRRWAGYTRGGILVEHWGWNGPCGCVPGAVMTSPVISIG